MAPSGGLVTVILPVHDGEAFLAEAIESVLAQTHGDLELLVADDGSTDGSREVVHRYASADARVVPLALAHGGIGATMNAAILRARGDLIARMDQDDIAAPGRLAAQLAFLQEGGVDACGCHAAVFGADTALYWFPRSHEAIECELHFRAAILGSTLLARAEVLRAHPYDESVAFDDYELITRLASRCRLGNVPLLLHHRRLHASNATRTQHDRVVRERARLRFRYVYARHPDTPLDDYLALTRLADRRPARTLEELDRAGRWLVRLAAPADPRLRRRQLSRWHGLLGRSTGLPAERLTIGRQYEQQLRGLLADAGVRVRARQP